MALGLAEEFQERMMLHALADERMTLMLNVRLAAPLVEGGWAGLRQFEIERMVDRGRDSEISLNSKTEKQSESILICNRGMKFL